MWVVICLALGALNLYLYYIRGTIISLMASGFCFSGVIVLLTNYILKYIVNKSNKRK